MAIVRKYRSEVVSIINSIENVYTVEFRSLDKHFSYSPGQFLHLAINEDYDGIGQWPESRCFSMQSNPDEDNIRITYAVKGEFTRQMKDILTEGSEVWLKLPYGNLFSQTHRKENTVFIAGGTGITPFLSLFTYSSFRDYSNPKIYLGFRSKEFNIYEEELEQLIKSNQSHVKLYYENTDGQIDIDQIFNKNGVDCDYFISGPLIMIAKFKQTLINKGLPRTNILIDDWE